MKKVTLIKSIAIFFLAGTIQFTACKNKSKNTTVNTDTTTVQTPSPAPVEIATDNELAKGVKDATKDFPGVTAIVDNGEVTLSGNIQRDRLTTLIQSIQSLHPKKVNNNLTIQ